MTVSARPSRRNNATSITVHVPLAFQHRGGRKHVVTPEGAPAWAPGPVLGDSTLAKALGRAHRWRRMLESGAFSTVAELAATERINSSYLARVLRLTLLAPDILESIMNGEHGRAVTLDQLLRPFPVEWSAQRARHMP
jgi:hypothetical protein